MTYVIFSANFWLFVVILLAVLCLVVELPYRLGSRHTFAVNMEAFNATQAGLLTLASFVLGLSFSQAQARMDSRRNLVTRETNAIRATWLRAGHLSAVQATPFRRTLIDYTATWLQGYQVLRAAPSERRSAYETTLTHIHSDERKMWAIALRAQNAQPGNSGLSLLTQQLNELLDASAEQSQALTGHIPTSVIVVMISLVTLGALSLGFRYALVKSRPLLMSAIYVIANVVVIGMIVDYDRPGSGLITVSVSPIQLQLQSMTGSP